MKNSVLIRIVIILAAYFGLTYFGGDIGRKILYPIRMLVTFLHEFGHAIGALITGGSVDLIQINKDGSGFTQSRGGSLSIILMGGYLGSAIFGNLLFLIGARFKKAVKPFLILLSATMLGTGVFWFNSLFTTIMLVIFALAILLIAFKTNFGNEVLMFLGLACIIFIIQDFNVGPSSDLQKYAELMVFIPKTVWMYIWLGIVLILTFFNFRIMFKSMKDDDPAINS